MGTSVDNDTPPSIQKLCNEIGATAAARVLVYALPRIRDLDRDLQALLLAGKRDAAAACAHRGLSSVRAYGTVQLEELLRQVSSEEVDLHIARAGLAAEFRSVINYVEDWLRRHDNMRHE